MKTEEDSDNSSAEELNEDDDSTEHEEEEAENDSGDSDADEEQAVVVNKFPVLQRISLKKSKSKKPSTQTLVDEAIQELNDKKGSSTLAIQKFIMNRNPDLIETRLKFQIKRYINKSLRDGTMLQIKRSFKLNNKNEMQREGKLKKKKAEPVVSSIKNKISTKKVNSKAKVKNGATQEKPESETIKKSASIRGTESKKTSQTKPKLPNKSIDMALKPQPKDLNKPTSTAAESKKLGKPTRSKNAAVATAPAAATISGRQRRK